MHFIYSNANRDAAALSGRSTHAIPAMVASLAFSGQVDMDEVLKTCSWKSHTTTWEFYLKDMTQVKDDLPSLSPVVAGQKVVAS